MNDHQAAELIAIVARIKEILEKWDAQRLKSYETRQEGPAETTAPRKRGRPRGRKNNANPKA